MHQIVINTHLQSGQRRLFQSKTNVWMDWENMQYMHWLFLQHLQHITPTTSSEVVLRLKILPQHNITFCHKTTLLIHKNKNKNQKKKKNISTFVLHYEQWWKWEHSHLHRLITSTSALPYETVYLRGAGNGVFSVGDVTKWHHAEGKWARAEIYSKKKKSPPPLSLSFTDKNALGAEDYGLIYNN